MARPSDVVLGLEIGAGSIQGRAFELAGAELGGASAALRRGLSSCGAIELDPIRVWQTVVEVVHGLARAVPDLGRRTVALGVTGSDGGLCLIDEDVEPVQPLVAAIDPTTLAFGDLDPMPALLERVVTGRTAALDRAAWALDLRGWILACLTGEALQVPPYEARESADGWTGGRPFLAPPAATPWRPLPLSGAAAAASGLWDETPVVVAPPAPVAAALAAGLADPDVEGGVALLGTDTWLIRPRGRPAAGSDAWASEFRPLQVHRGDVGGAALDGLIELAQSLLAEAGLIGLTRDDLLGLLLRPATRRRPGRVRFRRSRPAEQGPWTLEGLGASHDVTEIAGAIHEAIGRSCRDAFEASGGMPAEVRLAGALAASAPLREVLCDLLGVPLRLLRRPAPAAAGAALCALRGIDEVDRLERATRAWVDPFLSPPATSAPP